jgi:hypothetical protein
MFRRGGRSILAWRLLPGKATRLKCRVLTSGRLSAAKALDILPTFING